MIIGRLATTAAILLLIGQSSGFAQERRTGLIYVEPDPLNTAPIVNSNSLRIKPLPAELDMSAQLPSPGNQGNVNSCTAWAVAYALKSHQEYRESLSHPDVVRHIFSPMYIYNQINGGKDEGSSFTNAMRVLMDDGVVPYQHFNTFDFKKQPPAWLKQIAAPYRIASWRWLPNHVDTIKTVLAEGRAVVFSVAVFPDLRALSPTNPIYDDIRGKRESIPHAMAIIGYSNQLRAFKFINSWDTTWGLGGYGWISYDVVTADRNVTWFSAIDVQDARTGIPQGPSGGGTMSNIGQNYINFHSGSVRSISAGTAIHLEPNIPNKVASGMFVERMVINRVVFNGIAHGGTSSSQGVTLTLAATEEIVSMGGKVNHGAKNLALQHLWVRTSIGRFAQWGDPSSSAPSFEYHAPEGMSIDALWGNFGGSAITSVGVTYRSSVVGVGSSSLLAESGSAGGPIGSAFDDRSIAGHGVIRAFQVRHSPGKITSVRFGYSHQNGIQWAPQRGGNSGSLSSVTLNQGEYVIGVSGTYGALINNLVIRTSSNRVFSFGDSVGFAKFSFLAPVGAAFGAVRGRTLGGGQKGGDADLRAIGVTIISGAVNTYNL